MTRRWNHPDTNIFYLSNILHFLKSCRKFISVCYRLVSAAKYFVSKNQVDTGCSKSTLQKLPTCKIDLSDVVEVVQGVSVHHVDVIVHEHERSETWDTGQP